MQRSNPIVEKFYKSKEWKETQRLYKLSKLNTCERCGGLGKIVHHKNYISVENINNPDITLNFDNLELLCQDCHNKEHFEKSDYFFDEQGMIHPKHSPH